MEYTIILTEEELNFVVNALADKSYRDSAPIINKISGQVQAARTPATPVNEAG